MKGVGFDLGKEFARRMGVPFEPVVYPKSAALVGSVTSGQWDVTFLTVSARRANDMDFTAPHLEIERGYLIPSGSSISRLADVDQPGIRVAVTEKASSDIFRSRALKNAVLVRASGILGPLEMVKSGRADVFAAGKPTLFEISSQCPGPEFSTVVLPPTKAMALPKGRDLGMAYARKFVEDAKSEGLVKAAVERAGLRGVIAFPLK
jgi:polar amino acid transport system substrate-binding protein